jgi:hypothetical protein
VVSVSFRFGFGSVSAAAKRLQKPKRNQTQPKNPAPMPEPAFKGSLFATLSSVLDGKGFDTGPLGRGRVPELLLVFAVVGYFRWLPAGFHTLPALF